MVGKNGQLMESCKMVLEWCENRKQKLQKFGMTTSAVYVVLGLVQTSATEEHLGSAKGATGKL